ncbi:MAG: alpha-amylase [Bacteroidetes bacterium]|jgi:glycosidase|nr:alpha-amylase [Bacteroidota bacterium]
MDKYIYIFPLSLMFFILPYLSGQNSDSLRVYKQPLVKPLDSVENAVYPPSWWTGMEHDTVELMFHAKDIGGAKWAIEQRGIEVVGDVTLQNPNYRFLRCHIPSEAPAISYTFSFTRKDKSEVNIPFEILGQKKHTPRTLKGSDVMYLIMPDRFANGNLENDVIPWMREKSLDRSDVFKRHGGDLLGLRNRLDYLQNLGISAIWLNPILENDQWRTSYHGYAITDHYKIDARFGEMEDFLAYTADCRDRGIKTVKDMILNHCGSEHFFIRDLPDSTWVHNFKVYTKCNFRAPALMDPYAANRDRERFEKGWFDLHMPDLNQRHPQLANFLIQNALWWIEYAGLDAFRVDTYPYPYLDFTNRWNKSILREYPDFFIFGEAWVNAPAIQAYFSEKENSFPGGSNAPALADFQLYFALFEALTEPSGWTSGVGKLYLTLAQDFIYKNPDRNVTFIDNHDISRIWTLLDKDMDRWKMGMTMLMTLRGIPCLYYGTEVLLEGEGGAFGEQGRVDFPGGWPSDTIPAFEKSGRNKHRQEAFRLLKKLIDLRHTYPAISSGKLTQFIPQDGVYVFARTDSNHQFITLVNVSEHDRVIDPKKYNEVWRVGRSAYDHISGRRVESERYTLKAGATQLIQIGGRAGIIEE